MMKIDLGENRSTPMFARFAEFYLKGGYGAA